MNYKLIKANQRLADIFGYEKPTDMIGISMQDLHLSKEKFIQYGKDNFEALRLGTKRNVEYQLKRKNGTAVWCELSGKAFDNNIPADLRQVIYVNQVKKSDVEDLKRERAKHGPDYIPQTDPLQKGDAKIFDFDDEDSSTRENVFQDVIKNLINQDARFGNFEKKILYLDCNNLYGM